MGKLKLFSEASGLVVSQTFQKFLRSCTTTLIVTFLLGSPLANAYYISYDMYTPGETNAQLIANPQSTSFLVSYNSFSSVSVNPIATGDESGGVNVSWDRFSTPPTRDGLRSASLSFQILSDYGNLNPEPVAVDLEGYLYTDFLNDAPSPYFVACCGNLTFFELFGEGVGISVFSSSNIIYEKFERYGPGFDSNYFYQAISSYGYDETFNLLTNTTYNFYYREELYVEAGSGESLPNYFSSWDEYNAFLLSYAGSLYSTTHAKGSTYFDMELTSIEQPPISVPEPSILGLFGAGLIGLIGFSGRRKVA